MLFSSGVSNEDLYNFFYILSRYTGFGLKLNDAVSMYAEKTDSESMKELMKVIQKDLNTGMKFSDALAKHPSEFPSFIIENIRVGEISSQLNQILENLTFHLDQEIRVEKDIKAALLPQYIFMGILSIAVCIVIFFVLPKMGELLRSTDMELPWFTLLVVGFGDIASSFWWLFLILAIIGVSALKVYKENNPEAWDAFMLKMPFFGPINVNRLQYRFAMIFGLCLQAGIDTRRALEYTASAVDNRILKKTLQNAVRLMTQRGMALQDAIIRANEETKILNQDFKLMLAVGASGGLDEIMLNEAQKYREQTVRMSKNIGDKIGITIAVPGYAILLIMFAAIEFPILTLLGNMSQFEG